MAHAQTNTISVEIGTARTAGNAVNTAVTARAAKIAKLTDAAKERLLAKHPSIRISFPTRVFVTRNGARVSNRSPRQPGPITLQFNTAAGTTFPAGYQQFLQNVFNTTQSEMTRLFGQPFQTGTILVSNYDATIDDRDAVAGGIYLPNNGNNQQEIRFPEYGTGNGTSGFVMDPDSTAVNFVHCLLLAYQGTSGYTYDAFEEGLVRAVTSVIVREPTIQTALGLDAPGVEANLTATYDVQGSYDWDNQRALGGPLFIAPNLITSSPTIPVGTEGGAYLLRYRMSGSVWSKVLSEYPLFVAQLNSVVEANPGLASNVPGLISAAQTILNSDNPAKPTVEGIDFADWYAQQFILQTNITAGRKILVEVIPLTPDASQTVIPDFGLFDVETTYFATDAAGNETFPDPNGDIAYPVFLDNGYNRFSPDVQDNDMPFYLGYGAVTPNFLSSYNGGQIYRVDIDVPINDQIQRVIVPAGGVSTSLNTTTNDVYGTVTGDDPQGQGTEDVKIYVGSDLVTDAPVVNGAFGVMVESQYEAEYSIARQIEAQVWFTPTVGSPTMILDRFVDKPATGLLPDGSDVGMALDLRVAGTGTYGMILSPGINAIGLPIDPFSSDAGTVFGVPDSDLLIARYDGITGQYLLNPSVEPFKIGQGYFVQVPAQVNANLAGRSAATTPIGVALEPGWNLIGCPLPASTAGTSVLVYHADDLSTPSDFTDALSAGVLLGNTLFSFVPGANDPVAGYPTTGSFTAANSFVPGQAYFVQCLAPEGLVLEFIPNSLAPSIRRSAAPRAAAAPPMWQVHVKLAGAAGDSADCFLGIQQGATNGFDPALDCDIPPSMGGLQIASQSVGALYKDYRTPSNSVVYQLVATNLKIGKAYDFKFPCLDGNPLRTTMRGPQGVTVNVPRNGSFYFVATASSETFTYTVTGVRG